MELIDPLDLLKRTDKWYLGNGGMLVYAPPYPKHLGVPGFWDECHFGDMAVPRLLCVSFALETTPAEFQRVAGYEHNDPRAVGSWGKRSLVDLDPYLSYWHWYPDRIEVKHYLVLREGIGYKQQRGVRIFLNETRRIGPDGTLHCEFEFELLAGHPEGHLHAVAWTARQKNAAAGEAHCGFVEIVNGLCYTQTLGRRAHGRGSKPLPVNVSMSGTVKPTSVQVTPSHGAQLVPRLSDTPMWDALQSGQLSGAASGDNVLGSITFAALHWKLRLRREGMKPVGIRVRVTDAVSVEGKPLSRAMAREAAGRAASGYHQSLSTPDPAASWREFMSLVPHFECSDAMLTRYYWYRWYGLRLNAVPPGGKYIAPAVTEGIDYFRGVITYSLMCHLYECKWLADPALALGCLQNHLTHQTKSGHFAGHICYGHVNKRGFYHTDIGRSLAELQAHHPGVADSADLRAGLELLLRFYLSERDAGSTGLFDIHDQYETGQEFSSRYFHADTKADLYGWENKLRLKGVDVTAYVYHLLQLLEHHSEGSSELLSKLQRVRKAVAQRMWDPEREFFFDYSEQRKLVSPYWAAVGFYPLLSDLATDGQALAVGKHLMDRGKFATPWPTPTVPVDDPHYSECPRWRGERANCPWNGRVWPMVNSHIVEVYGRLATVEPHKFRPQLTACLRRFIEMMHFEQSGPGSPKDFTRPNCFEHYNPHTGTAGEYRGIDDYMHTPISST